MDENGLLLFELTKAIGELDGQINDGVVTRKSALREGHEHLLDWPVDHAGKIGWDKNSFYLISSPAAHPARYDAIVAIL